MSWDEYEAEGGGGVVEAGELFALHFSLLLAEDFRVEGFAVLEQMPEDARQVVGHRRDGFGRPQACLPAPIAIAEIVLGRAKPLRGQPQGGRRAALHVAGGREFVAVAIELAREPQTQGPGAGQGKRDLSGLRGLGGR